MGRLFLEYIDSKRLNFYCRHCKVVLTDIEYLKTLNIETVIGNCSTFNEMVNIYKSQKSTIGQFHKSSELYMYDFDAPLLCQYSGYCKDVYCNQCSTMLGWYHKGNNMKELFLILKTKIT